MSKIKKLQKNYLYIYAIILIFLITWYILSWINVKKDEQLMTSYLLTTNTINYEINDIDEISQILTESPETYFAYISYTNDEEIYKLEKNLKTIIDDYAIKDEFYYINISNYLKNKDVYTILNETFKTDQINNCPCFIYIKDRQIKNIINSKDKLFDYKDVEKILASQSFEKISQ